MGVQISLYSPDLSFSHCIPRYEIVPYGKPNLIFFFAVLNFFTEAAPVTSLPVASCTAFPPRTLSALHRTLQLWCWQGLLHLVGYAFGIYHSFFVFFFPKELNVLALTFMNLIHFELMFVYNIITFVYNILFIYTWFQLVR